MPVLFMRLMMKLLTSTPVSFIRPMPITVDIYASFVYVTDDKGVDVYTSLVDQIDDKADDETFKRAENCAVQ